MKTSSEITVLPWLLDCQIIDSTGKRCGKVDDLALEGKPGQDLRIKAIIVGAEAWSGRRGGILHKLIAKLVPDTVVYVPWKYVEAIKPLVILRVPAEKVGLGLIDDRLGKWMRRIPGAV